MDYAESNVECESVNLVFANSVSKSKRTNQVEKNGEIWFKQRANPPRATLRSFTREHSSPPRAIPARCKVHQKTNSFSEDLKLGFRLKRKGIESRPNTPVWTNQRLRIHKIINSHPLFGFNLVKVLL